MLFCPYCENLLIHTISYDNDARLPQLFQKCVICTFSQHITNPSEFTITYTNHQPKIDENITEFTINDPCLPRIYDYCVKCKKNQILVWIRNSNYKKIFICTECKNIWSAKTSTTVH